MSGWGWIVGGAAVVVLVTAAVVALLVRRRKARDADPLAVARRAIRQDARKQQRRRGRTPIRGKGGGGSEGQAIDAGSMSDSGGAP